MKYSSILKSAIEETDLSLKQICRRVNRHGFKLHPTILSKMQNGKHPPAKDALNIVLAEVLEIESNELRLTAIKELLPKELIELIQKVS